MSRPLTIADREAVIALMMSQVGYHEGDGRPPGESRLWTKFGDWYEPPEGFDTAAWCCMSMSWAHYKVLGFSPFPASTSKGAAAVVALVQWAKRTGHWVPGSNMGMRGDLACLKYPGDSIEHHVRLVTTPHGIRDYSYVAGNESNQVKVGRGRTSLSGYVRLDYRNIVVTPERPHAQDLGDPPFVQRTLAPGRANDPEDVKYLQRGLNLVLGLWGKPVHLEVDGRFGPATVLALEAFKKGANDKQWQGTPGHKVAQRMFVDVKDRQAGPKTLQYLRFFGLLG